LWTGVIYAWQVCVRGHLRDFLTPWWWRHV